MTKYEAKQRYAENKHRQNAEIESLTEEQHETLAWLCSVRHNLHTTDIRAWFKTDFDWDILDRINETLTEANLPAIEFADYSDVTTEDDWYYILDEDDRAEYEDINEWIDEVIHEVSNAKEAINNQIESYLRQIDKEHGTEYCPTGHARLY